MAKCTKIDFGWGSAPDPAGGAYDAPLDPLVGWGGIPPPHTLPLSAPRPSRLRRLSRRLRRLDPSLLTPSAFGCLTEAEAHPTSSFWRRHCQFVCCEHALKLSDFVTLMLCKFYCFSLRIQPPLTLFRVSLVYIVNCILRATLKRLNGPLLLINKLTKINKMV